MTTATLQKITSTRHYSALPPATREGILADIGRGVDSYTAIARRYNVAISTVQRMAGKRGIPSPFSPRLLRTEAANRAVAREQRAHKALEGKALDQCDPEALSRIAERASVSASTHLAALERADTPATTIVISPELRLLAMAFVGQLPQPERVIPVAALDKSAEGQ